MAITFVGAYTRQSNLSSAITLNVPTGTQNGDLLLVNIVYYGVSSTLTAPSGWTQLDYRTLTSSTGAVYWFWRIADNEPASYTFTLSSNTGYGAAISSWRGVDTTAAPVFAVSSAYYEVANLVHPSVTTTVDGSTILRAVSAISTNNLTAPSGTTQRWNFGNATYGWVLGASHEQATAGPTGTATSTTTDLSSSRSYAYTIVLAVAPVTGPQVKPSGIASTAAVGSPTLLGPVRATSIASTATVGTPAILGPIMATGMASSAAVGTPHVVRPVIATGIVSSAAVGTPLAREVIRVQPVGIASVAAVGAPHVILPVVVGGIPASSAVGEPHVTGPALPTGIAPVAGVGVPVVVLPVRALGIPAMGAVGTPAVIRPVALLGIPSAAAVGTPFLPSGATTAGRAVVGPLASASAVAVFRASGIAVIGPSASGIVQPIVVGRAVLGPLAYPLLLPIRIGGRAVVGPIARIGMAGVIVPPPVVPPGALGGVHPGRLAALREGDLVPVVVPYAGFGGRIGLAMVLGRTIDERGELTLELALVQDWGQPEVPDAVPPIRHDPAERESTPRRIARVERDVARLRHRDRKRP